MFWLGFLLGVVVGTCMGALLIAVCTAAAMADQNMENISYQQPNESDQP